jgi:hypothetical protein
MTVVIFAGPTLHANVPTFAHDFEFLPPAAEGDLYRAARRRITAIGLIDGTFETAPSVWHKEILWALSRGIHVYGAASMGALRAAELDTYGMIGIGAIYNDFRRGVLRDDDEVAVLHASGELGYQPLTEAMVDIRATLMKAQHERVISRKSTDALTDIGKATFFKDRTWDAILRAAVLHRVPEVEIERFADWLPVNRVEQKRRDALALLRRMRRHLAVRHPPFRPRFCFQRTDFWRTLTETHAR